MFRFNPSKWLLSICFLPVCGHAQAQFCLTAPSGLVSWWPGDTNENDIISGVNPEHVTAVTLVPGEVGNGFSFGNDGYIEIAATPTLANQQFTWLAWVKPEGPGPNNDAAGSVIVAQSVTGYYNNVSLQWSALNSNFLFIFGADNTELINSPSTFPAGSYYLVSGTYDGSTFQLMVNGQPQGSYAETKTVTYSSNPWMIGSTEPDFISEGYPRTWNGVIDEVQAYDRALSQSEIQAIYSAASGGVCKGLTSTSLGLTFPRQPVGTTSAPQTVTATNSFPLPVTVYSVVPTAEFAETNTCPVSPSTLAPGASCNVNVTFTPTSDGKQTGALTFNDSAPASNLIFTLTGAATDITLTPPELEFGTRTVGVTTPPKSLTVKNVGTAKVKFTGSGIVIGGADPANFIVSSTTCGATLAAGASCTVSVEFEPTVQGTAKATLEFNDDGGSSPQTVTLIGQAG